MHLQLSRRWLTFSFLSGVSALAISCGLCLAAADHSPGIRGAEDGTVRLTAESTAEDDTVGVLDVWGFEYYEVVAMGEEDAAPGLDGDVG